MFTGSEESMDDVAAKKKQKAKRLEVAREVNLLENIDHHENAMVSYCLKQFPFQRLIKRTVFFVAKTFF